MKKYCFDVRETTVRTAFVEASSAAEARELLRQLYAQQNLEHPSVSLGDYDSVGMTFRSVVTPTTQPPANSDGEQQ